MEEERNEKTEQAPSDFARSKRMISPRTKQLKNKRIGTSRRKGGSNRNTPQAKNGPYRSEIMRIVGRKPRIAVFRPRNAERWMIFTTMVNVGIAEKRKAPRSPPDNSAPLVKLQIQMGLCRVKMDRMIKVDMPKGWRETVKFSMVTDNKEAKPSRVGWIQRSL